MLLLKARIRCETFLSEYFMKHRNMNSRNAFTLVCEFHCVCFSSIKKMYLQRKYVSENLVALILMHNISYFRNKNKKNKKTKTYLNETRNENRNDKTARMNIFSDFLITDKFEHYPRMNATLYNWSYTDFYILITNTSFIAYTCVIKQHALLLHHVLIFTIYDSTRFSFLQISPSLLRN